jgi:hypothetical protein
MRMPRKSGEVVFRHVVAEVVEQKEWIKVLRISKSECAPKVHAGTFEGGLRLD